MSDTTVPDIDLSDSDELTEAITNVLTKSKSRVAADVLARLDSLTNHEVWAMLHRQTREAIIWELQWVKGKPEREAAHAAKVEQDKAWRRTIQAALESDTPQAQALWRAVTRNHPAGAEVSIEMHNAYVDTILEGLGSTDRMANTDHRFCYFPEPIKGVEIYINNSRTPAQWEDKERKTYERILEKGPEKMRARTLKQYPTIEDYIDAARKRDEQHSSTSPEEADILQVRHRIKRKPWQVVKTYIAPMTVPDDHIDTYETLRASGHSPQRAEESVHLLLA